MTYILDPKTGHKVPMSELRGDDKRKGDWIETYTGGKVWPLDPRAWDFDAMDIAHSLSMLCRYNGHCREFYSMAEHSCHLHDYALHILKDKPLARTLLIHDAAEAYLGIILRCWDQGEAKRQFYNRLCSYMPQR